jgi:hypothetical protein
MPQQLPQVPVEDLRARVDVDPVYAPDELLHQYIVQAEAVVGAELDPDGDYLTAENVREAVAQVAVKLWDLRSRGLGGDLDGDIQPAAMPATSGLVRSVRGLLLPSMPTGGLTV